MPVCVAQIILEHFHLNTAVTATVHRFFGAIGSIALFVILESPKNIHF